MRRLAILMLIIALSACQVSGTSGSSSGTNASIFTNILTLQF